MVGVGQGAEIHRMIKLLQIIRMHEFDKIVDSQTGQAACAPGLGTRGQADALLHRLVHALHHARHAARAFGQQTGTGTQITWFEVCHRD